MVGEERGKCEVIKNPLVHIHISLDMGWAGPQIVVAKRLWGYTWLHMIYAHFIKSLKLFTTSHESSLPLLQVCP